MSQRSYLKVVARGELTLYCRTTRAMMSKRENAIMKKKEEKKRKKKKKGN